MNFTFNFLFLVIMSASDIVQKVKKRYTETHENSVMLINPNIKWNVLTSSTKHKEVMEQMKKIFTEEKYNNNYLTIISVNCNEKTESVSLGIDFYFYKDNKNIIGKSFGKSIVISDKELVKLGDLTHQIISDVVVKMFEKGKNLLTVLNLIHMKIYGSKDSSSVSLLIKL